MKTKVFIPLLAIVNLVVIGFTQSLQKSQPDYVPNKETAIKIAEVILIPIYGEEILNKRPFSAKLINNEVWRVEGTMMLDELGGVPVIEIQKSDCKILSVTHTK